jgi:hypothetical protein
VLGEGSAVRWIGGSFSVTLAKNTLGLLDQFDKIADTNNRRT